MVHAGGGCGGPDTTQRSLLARHPAGSWWASGKACACGGRRHADEARRAGSRFPSNTSCAQPPLLRVPGCTPSRPFPGGPNIPRPLPHLGVPVGLAEDCHRGDAEAAGGGEHAARNLAAVGHKHFAEGGWRALGAGAAEQPEQAARGAACRVRQHGCRRAGGGAGAGGKAAVAGSGDGKGALSRTWERLRRLERGANNEEEPAWAPGLVERRWLRNGLPPSCSWTTRPSEQQGEPETASQESKRADTAGPRRHLRNQAPRAPPIQTDLPSTTSTCRSAFRSAHRQFGARMALRAAALLQPAALRAAPAAATGFARWLSAAAHAKGGGQLQVSLGLPPLAAACHSPTPPLPATPSTRTNTQPPSQQVVLEPLDGPNEGEPGGWLMGGPTHPAPLAAALVVPQ